MKEGLGGTGGWPEEEKAPAPALEDVRSLLANLGWSGKGRVRRV